MIKWNRITRNEDPIIENIVQRLVKYGYEAGCPVDRMPASMDIRAAHLAHPLRLAELLAADEFNFKHDVYGILNHIDRNTGEMKDFFCPRFSFRSV
jgi:hypothetical protein